MWRIQCMTKWVTVYLKSPVCVSVYTYDHHYVLTSPKIYFHNVWCCVTHAISKALGIMHFSGDCVRLYWNVLSEYSRSVYFLYVACCTLQFHCRFYKVTTCHPIESRWIIKSQNIIRFPSVGYCWKAWKHFVSMYNWKRLRDSLGLLMPSSHIIQRMCYAH